METKIKAKEIYNYLKQMLADGVYIKPSLEKEFIKEVALMLEND